MGSVLPYRHYKHEETENFRLHVSDHIDGTRIDPDLIGVKSIADSVIISDRKITIFELYPLSNELRPELPVAFTLLKEGLQYVSDAIDMQNKGDIISSDDAIHRLQALLPELFCCRSLSDGFGSIISAVYHSISKMNGIPLNTSQLSAVKRVLNRISTEPFLEFSEAVDEIMTLEDAGFEVEPPYYDYAADMLDA